MEFDLAPDVRKRLAERGIDPEGSCEAWLAAIRDGTYDVTQLLVRLGKAGAPVRDRRSVPIVIPLAVVLPSEP